MATPLTAVVSPRGLPPLGLLTVTLPLKEVSTVPKLSSAVTTGPKPLPAVTLLGGWLVTTNCVATPGGVTSMALVVAEISPLDTSR